MELIVLVIGVAVVLISAILVFFVSFRVVKERSFEEVAAEKSRRERAIEEELGIRGKDAAKKDKKKKKEKKGREAPAPTEETEVTAGSSDDSDELVTSRPDAVESKKLLKGKKQKSVDSDKVPEKTDSKKSGKTSQSAGNKAKPGDVAKENTVQSSKGQPAKAKKEQDDVQKWPEVDVPFIVAESKHKKKKQAASAEASASASKPVARETVVTVANPKVDASARVETRNTGKGASNFDIILIQV